MDENNIEHQPLGRVVCDFIRPDAFQSLCEQWLTQPNHANLHHIVTLNPEMVMTAEHDHAFAQAVNQAQLRVPDGAGLIWAQWYIRSQFWSLIPSLLAFSFRSVERITGIETVWILARLCAQHHRPLYLLGGTPHQVQQTARVLQQELPDLVVAVAPDHRYDAAGPASIIADINQHRPAVLLVAYGSPRQAIWIERHRKQLNEVRIAVGVGGAFAILSEDRPRAPRWLRRLNLEWLWRLLLEPARLPRIWQATVKFPLLIKHQKILHPPTYPGSK